jgi:hypothetical protein
MGNDMDGIQSVNLSSFSKSLAGAGRFYSCPGISDLEHQACLVAFYRLREMLQSNAGSNHDKFTPAIPAEIKSAGDFSVVSRLCRPAWLVALLVLLSHDHRSLAHGAIQERAATELPIIT